MPSVALPAPFGGMNGLSASQLMQPNQAIALWNWIPGDNYVSTRGATVQVSSTHPGTYIYSAWSNSSGTPVLAGNGNLYRYNVAAPIATGLASDLWHGNQFQDITILCNGADTPRIYNGTTAPAGTYSGSGLTASLLYGSLTFKGRVLYWESNARHFWYAAAASYQGALSKFDVSRWMQSDSVITSMATLTNDGGDGPDDLLVIMASGGECIIYQGDDPGSAMGWQMAGRFRISKPLGRACWANIGSTTIVGTKTGVVDLGVALRVGPGDRSATFGADLGDYWVSGDISDIQFIYDSNQEILWAANWNAGEIVDTGLNQVFGMDISSRAWFLTDGIGYRAAVSAASKKATAMFGWNGGVYFVSGGTGVTYSGPTRAADGVTNDGITGGAMTYYAQSGYNALGSLGQKKQIAGVVLDMRAYGATSPNVTSCAVSVTSELTGDQNSITYAATGTDMLDGLYRGEIKGYGTSFQHGVTVTGKGGLVWYATRFLVNPGGEL